MSYEFAKVLSWDSLYDTIGNGFKDLNVPHFSTFFKDVAALHEQTDTIVFALILGLVFAFVCWFLSLVTGLHTWVRPKI